MKALISHFLQTQPLTREVLAALLMGMLCLMVPATLPAAENNTAGKNQVTRAKDLNYGAILYQFYQQNYFDALVEYQYAMARGGISQHGDYPEVLDGGISLSYGLTNKAESIFTKLIDDNLPDDDKNRAWFYLSKLFYQKGQMDRAVESLAQIRGKVPKDIGDEYRYLATLVNIDNGYFDAAESSILSVSEELPYEPYLYFNLAVAQAKKGELSSATKSLDKVTQYGRNTEELSSLTDRAHFTMALLSSHQEQLQPAWSHLQKIKTTGLYSNKALLSYSWMSIKLQQYEHSVSALNMLQDRSIALSSVQEAVLLLPHVYEKQGHIGLALKGFVDAESQFQQGLSVIEGAREAINQLKLPEDFIRNMETIVKDDDWYGEEVSVDYQKLSPFLLELMASHSFQAIVHELSDLYHLRRRLEGWKHKQSDFELMLQTRRNVNEKAGFKESVRKQQAAHQSLMEQYEYFRLKTLALPVEDQERFSALLDATYEELSKAEQKASHLQSVAKPMHSVASYQGRIESMQNKIDAQKQEADRLIAELENLLRKVVNAQLDQHEERVNYYLAQSRLAKARLYDLTLNALPSEAEGGEE